MKIKPYILLLVFLGGIGCKAQKANYLYESETLLIEQLSKNTFRHVTYLKTEKFGNVACNGMIVIDKGEALIFDTPANDPDSKELILWIENTLKCKPKGVVVTHFHIDCLGGLNEFHNRQIPSYATNLTIDFAKSHNRALPQNGFGNYFEIKVGNKKVVNEFMGEGHTKDNIISYFPSEKVLFGGCLVKEIGAGKGNLEDANVSEWSKTVEGVKAKYENAEIIVPGHGEAGNQGLLDYTIQLFSKE